jgi:hypothetical protein
MTAPKMATRDIIQKWLDQGGIMRFKDGDKGNCDITNLEYVTIAQAMQNVEEWTTNWDLPLTKKEKNKVMQPDFRAGFYLSVGDVRRHGSVSAALSAAANYKK